MTEDRVSYLEVKAEHHRRRDALLRPPLPADLTDAERAQLEAMGFNETAIQDLFRVTEQDDE